MLLKSQVKYIQSLGQKKFRDREQVFPAEGPKIIHELLQSPSLELLQLYALKEWIRDHQALVSKLESGLVNEIAPQELERLSSLSTPHEVLAVFRKPKTREIPLRGRLTLVLDNIQDPGNLGTLVRIADWFGLDQMICSRGSADAFNPKTIQASMGSISRVQVLYEDLPGLLRNHPSVKSFAAVLDGPSVYGLGKMEEALLVIGNESQGIGSELLGLCRERISIPRKGRAESLNAAVAAGIILSHLVR